MTQGTWGGDGDGMAIIVQRGLYGWIAHIGTAPRSKRSTPPTASAVGPAVMVTTRDRSPLVDLCADMLLARLLTQEVR